MDLQCARVLSMLLELILRCCVQGEIPSLDLKVVRHLSRRERQKEASTIRKSILPYIHPFKKSSTKI